MSHRKTPIPPFFGGASPLNGGKWWCPDRHEIMTLSTACTGNAETMDRPFAMPNFLAAQFAALRGYWNSLKRGNAEIPFTDDFSPGALGKMAADIALIHVFQHPQRFRFDMAGTHVTQVYGGELENRFADDVSLRPPLDFLVAQCTSTVESAAPTFYNHSGTGSTAEYQRLMLPFWGDGRLDAILTSFGLRGGIKVV